MAHVLKQHGDNSVTYSFVTTGSGDFLSLTDWEAIPKSRIKTILRETYASYTALHDALASAGFSVTLCTGFNVGNPTVSLTGPAGTILVGYAGPGPGLPGYDWPIGTHGTLRISLAYSASE